MPLRKIGVLPAFLLFADLLDIDILDLIHHGCFDGSGISAG